VSRSRDEVRHLDGLDALVDNLCKCQHNEQKRYIDIRSGTWLVNSVLCEVNDIFRHAIPCLLTPGCTDGVGGVEMADGKESKDNVSEMLEFESGV
jgi:hypothetical protein